MQKEDTDQGRQAIISMGAVENELLTIEDLVARLKVPKSWIYARSRIKGGDFPVIRLGKYLRFRSVESILEWEAKQNNSI